jgi:hypothetical protein
VVQRPIWDGDTKLSTRFLRGFPAPAWALRWLGQSFHCGTLIMSKLLMTFFLALIAVEICQVLSASL